MKSKFKKKQIIFKLSHAYAVRNRKSNIILELTTAFSITALFLLLSIVNSRVKVDDLKSIRENGNRATAILENISEEQYLSLKELSYIDELEIIQNFGVWYQNGKKLTTCSVVNEECFHNMFLPAYDNVVGNYPKSANEIMLPVRILDNLGIEEPEIGMELSVHIVLYDWFKNGTEDVDMIFRLSGYYTDYVENVEKLPKLFFSKEFVESQNISFFIYDALIRSDKLWMNSTQIEKQISSDIGLVDNQNLLVMNEGISKTIRIMMGNTVFAVGGILLILLSMNFFIYNIYSISVNKEKQEYGLLKVIGAEPKQIKEIFIFLELKILIVGCLLGILFGSLLVIFFLPTLFEKLSLWGNETIHINSKELYSWKLLFLVVMLCGLGEMYAFRCCIRSVLKLSPIECSKYEEKISLPHIKKNSKRFGILGIAWRNFTRNKKKMLETIVSLFIAIEVFLLSVVISNGLDQTNRISQEPDFKVGVTKEAVEHYLRLNEGRNLEDLKGHQLVSDKVIFEIIEMAGIKSDSIKKCVGGFGTFSYNSEAIRPRIDSWQYDSEIVTDLTVQVVSEEWIDELETYVRKKGYPTNIDTLKDGNGFILLHNHELSIEQTKKADAVIGQKLSGVLFEDSGNEFEIVCCGYLDFSEDGFPKLNMPWDGKNLNYIIISEKTMMDLEMKTYIYNISFDVSREDEPTIKRNIQCILRDANQYSEITNTYDMIACSDILDKEQSYILAIRIIMGGFSGILILFALVSYFNTLLSGYISRNKELIIMRKIGMTIKQLKTMLVYEGVFYCMSTLVLILTLGNGILFLVGRLMHNQVSYFTFKYPFICILGIFIVMFLVSIFLPLFYFPAEQRKEK